jgi:adenosylcobyric acid synthase
MGRTRGDHAWLEITERSGAPVSVADGLVANQGRLWGCYLHGLFENQALRHAWLSSLGWPGPRRVDRPVNGQEDAFDRLADGVEAALNMELLEEILNGFMLY